MTGGCMPHARPHNAPARLPLRPAVPMPKLRAAELAMAQHTAACAGGCGRSNSSVHLPPCGAFPAAAACTPSTHPYTRTLHAGMQEAAKLLLSHGVQPGACAMDDMNACHFAAQKGHTDLVRALLAAGGCHPRGVPPCRVLLQPPTPSAMQQLFAACSCSHAHFNLRPATLCYNPTPCINPVHAMHPSPTLQACPPTTAHARA